MTASSKQTNATNEKHQILKSMNHLSLFMILAVCLAACTKTHKTPQDLTTEKLSVKGQPSSVLSSALPASALIPDLQTVVPQHLQVVRAHQRDLLRFSN